MHEDKSTIINNGNKKITIFRIRHLFEFLKIWKYNKKHNWSTENYKIVADTNTFNILLFMAIKVIDMKFNKHVYFIV